MTLKAKYIKLLLKIPVMALFLLWFATLSTKVWGLRIVSTSPQITELLFQLGKGSDVVGTTDFSFYPAQANQIAKIGPLSMPSFEKTWALAPDWILTDSTFTHPGFIKSLRSFHISHLELQIHSLDALLVESKRVLRTLYGNNADVPEHLEACIKALTRNYPSKTFPFLGVLWNSPPILIGSTSFLSHIIQSVGGKNAAPTKWKTPYPQVSEEWLLFQKIDVVYYLTDISESEMQSFVTKLWPNKPIRLVPLSAAHFARASFTPLLHLDELLPLAAIPKTCLQRNE